MSGDQQIEKCLIETNNRYNEVVKSVASLATGALVLPVLFLRQFIGVPAEKPLMPFLTCSVYWAWGCLIFSVFFGIIYSWFSIKWVKSAFKQKIYMDKNSLESVLDFLFVLMMILFFLGIIVSIYFFISVHVVSI